MQQAIWFGFASFFNVFCLQILLQKFQIVFKEVIIFVLLYVLIMEPPQGPQGVNTYFSWILITLQRVLLYALGVYILQEKCC